MIVRITNYLNKKGYIKENTFLTMNLKERGITVGDLLILLLIILTTTIVLKSFKKDKKTTFNPSTQEKLYFNKTLLSKIHLNNFSI